VVNIKITQGTRKRAATISTIKPTARSTHFRQEWPALGWISAAAGDSEGTDFKSVRPSAAVVGAPAGAALDVAPVAGLRRGSSMAKPSTIDDSISKMN
jgi:hypothetical protein